MVEIVHVPAPPKRRIRVVARRERPTEFPASWIVVDSYFFYNPAIDRYETLPQFSWRDPLPLDPNKQFKTRPMRRNFGVEVEKPRELFLGCVKTTKIEPSKEIKIKGLPPELRKFVGRKPTREVETTELFYYSTFHSAPGSRFYECRETYRDGTLFFVCSPPQRA